MASRVPISRVRSVALMIITLAMPMPPMTRLTAAASAKVASPIRAPRPARNRLPRTEYRPWAAAPPNNRRDVSMTRV
jgi:hypothetical protein